MPKRYFKKREDAAEFAHTYADLIAHTYKRAEEAGNPGLLPEAGKLYFLASKKLEEGGLLFLLAKFKSILKAYAARYDIKEIDRFVSSVQSSAREYEVKALEKKVLDNPSAFKERIERDLDNNFFSRVG